MADTQQRTDGQNEVATQQSSQGTQTTRNQQRGMSRRSSDPLFISPREFFNTSPFALMRRMSEEMDRIFGDSGSGRNQGDDRTWTPAIEVAERDGKYVVHAELPGLKPEEVSVEVTDDTIVIQGERQSQTEDNQGGIRRTERRYGRFYRAIPLPEQVNASDIQAKFENGVLEITAPVPQQQSHRRQVPIQSEATGSTSGTSSNTPAGSNVNPSSTRNSGSSTPNV